MSSNKQNSSKKLIGKGFARVLIISLFATLACAGIIRAATTIGNNITTGGTITGSGTNNFYGATSIGGALTATSTLNVAGLTTLGNASTTLLSVTGNSYLATTSISGKLTITDNINMGNTNCSLACNQGNAAICNVDWNASAKTLTAQGTSKINWSDCFEPGDIVWGGYIYGFVESINGDVMTLGSAINRADNLTDIADTTWQTNKGIGTKDAVLGKYATNISSGIYINAPNNDQSASISGQQAPFQVSTWDQDSLGNYNYPSFNIASDLDHHASAIFTNINDQANSTYGVVIGTERRQGSDGICGVTSTQNNALRIIFKDTTTYAGICAADNTAGNKSHYGAIHASGRITVADNVQLTYNQLNGVVGDVSLTSGDLATIGTASGLRAKILSMDGTITNAVGLVVQPFAETTPAGTGTGITNSIGVRLNDQTVGDNIYGMILDDGSEGIYFGGTGGSYIKGNTTGIGIGTSTPSSLFTVNAGSSATTTVEFGDQYSAGSKTCFNVKTSSGANASFYFNSSGIVFETHRCN